MSKSQSLQRILAQAKKKEKKYDWLGAVEFHKKAADYVLQQEDFLTAGDIEERIGYCFHRAAMQAESREQFKERMQRAVEEYEKAHGVYEQLGDEQKARMFRCKAVAKYLGYWLASETSEKRRLLNECLRLTKEALKAFEEAGDSLEYGRTFNNLSSAAYHSFTLEWDFQAREKIIREAMEYGERTITLLSTVGDSPRSRLARAYAKTAVYLGIFIFYFIPDMNEKERYIQKGRDYWQKANELSEETALLELLNTQKGSDWLFSFDEMLVHHEKALGIARTTQDKYLMGTALDVLAYASFWKSNEIEDPDKRVEFAQRALKYAEDAKHQFSSISFVSPRGGVVWTGAPHSDYYWLLTKWETDLRKKRDLLEKAIIDGTRAIKLAQSSGYPEIITYTHHVLSKVLGSLAHVETSLEKRRLLEKALEHRKESIRIDEELDRFVYWSRGVMWNYLADIKAELSNVERNSQNIKNILEEAISDKERCLQLCTKGALYHEKGQHAALGDYQYSYGELLNHLYSLTNNNEHQRRAIKALEEAAESLQKLDMVSRVAECYWKAGRWCDALGEHLKAAENFTLASNNYKSATEKIPQLKNFYQDHASYMQAWSEIETAKHHHAEKQYGQARGHYEKATNLHKSTERWNYLSPNYLAWARLEEAEDLSRREETQEAKNLFQQVAKLFVEAKKSIQARLERIEDVDEKEMAGELAKASDVRYEYCLGRIALEEAKILDRQGDHTASSRKYGSAAEIFQEIAKAEPEESRKELQPVVYLCQAWQKMMMAEAKVSSTIYGEAAELFKRAKEHTLDQPTSLLALANSSFCKALEAGTEFEVTRDMKTYSTAKKHMEAAANHYLKAGFKTASEYAKATHRLFDAHIYTNKAQTETEPRKKAKYYQMAEKLLQASAGSYTKAKHPEKSEEVQRLLENIREERQLAMSLAEVLHAPTIASTTTSFTTPTPTHEKAVGLERFEHADIQANLTAPEEVIVGEEVKVRFDLVNVAKNFGLLVRVDDLIPPGFKVTVSPSQYNIENGSIDMKGRRLEPLKVESIKFSLRATEAGVSSLSPQVIYADEVGKFRTCRPEPATVTVHPRLVFEFETQAAQKVFDFLIKSFVEDYMRRRMSLERSGWRTSMEIVKHGKVSKSSIYGARGHRGRAVSELERRGLVETRVFLGERGRGGKILKMRISYDKDTIKRYIDQRIMKIKEK